MESIVHCRDSNGYTSFHSLFSIHSTFHTSLLCPFLLHIPTQECRTRSRARARPQRRPQRGEHRRPPRRPHRRTPRRPRARARPQRRPYREPHQRPQHKAKVCIPHGGRRTAQGQGDIGAKHVEQRQRKFSNRHNLWEQYNIEQVLRTKPTLLLRLPRENVLT